MGTNKEQQSPFYMEEDALLRAVKRRRMLMVSFPKGETNVFGMLTLRQI